MHKEPGGSALIRTRITFPKPAFTVFETSSTDFAPLITAMHARYAARLVSSHAQSRSRVQHAVAPGHTNSQKIWMGATMSWLASSMPRRAVSPDLPAKARWSAFTSVCDMGADTRKPYTAILNAFEDTCARARTCTRNGAFLPTRGGGAPARCDARISWKNCRNAARERGVSTRGSGEGATRCRRACGDRLGAQGVRGEAAQVRREQRVHLVGCRDCAHRCYLGDEEEVVVVVERGREGIMGRELWGWYIYAQSPRTSHGPASLSRSRSRSIALVPSLPLGYSGFSPTPHSSPFSYAPRRASYPAVGGTALLICIL